LTIGTDGTAKVMTTAINADYTSVTNAGTLIVDASVATAAVSLHWLRRGADSITRWCKVAIRYIGGAGKDPINGRCSPDSLVGGAGNDTINGGSGNDILTGGAGSDTFNVDAGTDTITDFDAAADTIKLAVGASVVTTANGPLTEFYTSAITLSHPATAAIIYGVGGVALQPTTGAVKSFDASTQTSGVTIKGSAANDAVLSGSAVCRTLSAGGLGNDTINGGAGAGTNLIVVRGMTPISLYRCWSSVATGALTVTPASGTGAAAVPASLERDSVTMLLYCHGG
jgi:Ca2+-binding RTX toxin-like protein